MSWHTFGHEQIKSILSKQIIANKFPNAYLFSGVEGIGKKTLALEFAQKVLGVDRLSNHPDFIFLEHQGEITLDLTLEFISKLAFKPFVAKKKVAIIDNAENLNINSSNALLKSLEEPSSSTIVILISGRKNILPTIISRCQVLRFSVFSDQELENYAKTNLVEISQNAINLSFGRIDRLKKFAEEKKFLEEQKTLASAYENFKKMSVGERLLFIGEYAEKESEELETDFKFWLNYQLKNLNKEPKKYKNLQALTEGILGLGMNKNKKLLLQNLFLHL